MILVLLPYEITLLSNRVRGLSELRKFYYLMKLHYSQTSQTASRPMTDFTTL